MPDQPMNLTPGCTMCEHNAETLGVEMPTESPVPGAVEAVARAIARDTGLVTPWDSLPDSYRSSYQGFAASALMFIRGAIHRDGDDADAIREALGLSWAPLMGGRILSGEWQEIQP